MVEWVGGRWNYQRRPRVFLVLICHGKFESGWATWPVDLEARLRTVARRDMREEEWGQTEEQCNCSLEDGRTWSAARLAWRSAVTAGPSTPLFPWYVFPAFPGFGRQTVPNVTHASPLSFDGTRTEAGRRVVALKCRSTLNLPRGRGLHRHAQLCGSRADTLSPSARSFRLAGGSQHEEPVAVISVSARLPKGH